MSYKKHFCVLWNGRESQVYLMNAALKLACRMRRLGHTVRVVRVHA